MFDILKHYFCFIFRKFTRETIRRCVWYIKILSVLFLESLLERSLEGVFDILKYYFCFIFRKFTREIIRRCVWYIKTLLLFYFLESLQERALEGVFDILKHYFWFIFRKFTSESIRRRCVRYVRPVFITSPLRQGPM